MAQSLTLVLPVHNAAGTLPRQVDELLTIAGELTSQFELLVIDDGSDDDTFEVASELAIRFPQIRVTRHGHHRGLGPTLRSLRGRVKSDVVIVQDGGSLLDAAQVRRLWEKRSDSQFRLDVREIVEPTETCASDLLAPSHLHPAMAAAHRRLGLREMLAERESAGKDESQKATQRVTTTAASSLEKQSGVGHIPPVPAGSLFGSVSDFALGE